MIHSFSIEAKTCFGHITVETLVQIQLNTGITRILGVCSTVSSLQWSIGMITYPTYSATSVLGLQTVHHTNKKQVTDLQNITQH